MSDPRYPSLYQINTRVWLTELSRPLGRRATLDDVPDAELDRLAGKYGLCGGGLSALVVTAAISYRGAMAG